jgi:hypothetical protein
VLLCIVVGIVLASLLPGLFAAIAVPSRMFTFSLGDRPSSWRDQS